MSKMAKPLGKMAADNFSLSRLFAIMLKELLQLKREPVTLAMMFITPVLQLLIFGFAINTDPRNLPTVVVNHDQGMTARTLILSMQNSSYFKIVDSNVQADVARDMLRKGQVQFVVTIPPDFDHDIVRGEVPTVLMEADATDPAVTGNALAALPTLATNVMKQVDLGMPTTALPNTQGFQWRVHRNFNPEGSTAYNIIPGLISIILSTTMIMMTALGISREVERGTMENLLATPVRPIEVMLGKIAPYIFIGYIQVAIILFLAQYIFGVPYVGGVLEGIVCILLFMLANLAVGISISAISSSQTQVLQLAFLYYMPSILLSGFVFPFRGMPVWAQTLGEVLPITHFLRIIRGIMLKGSTWAELWPNIWPLMLFIVIVMGIGLKAYRRTLD